MKLGLLALPLVALLLAPACARRADEMSVPVRFTPRAFTQVRVSGDTATVHIGWLELGAGLSSAARDSANAWQWTMLLQLGGGDSTARDTTDLAARFFAEWNGDSLLLPDGPRWTLDRRIEVEGDTLGVLTLALRTYWFAGGVHPSERTVFATFDRRTGHAVGFDDLFRAGARDSMDRTIEPLFRAQNSLAPGDTLELMGYWWEDGRFHLNDNLALRGDGVRFWFNEYEIAPYAMGPTDLTVPPAMFLPFVRRDGPYGAKRAR